VHTGAFDSRFGGGDGEAASVVNGVGGVLAGDGEEVLVVAGVAVAAVVAPDGLMAADW